MIVLYGKDGGRGNMKVSIDSTSVWSDSGNLFGSCRMKWVSKDQMNGYRRTSRMMTGGR